MGSQTTLLKTFCLRGFIQRICQKLWFYPLLPFSRRKISLKVDFSLKFDKKKSNIKSTIENQDFNISQISLTLFSIRAQRQTLLFIQQYTHCSNQMLQSLIGLYLLFLLLCQFGLIRRELLHRRADLSYPFLQVALLAVPSIDEECKCRHQ